MPLFAAILHGPESSSKLSDCFHTAEVAGSNPASPTLKIQPALSLRHNVSPAKRSVKLTLSWSAVVIRSVSCCVDRGASPEAGGPPPLPPATDCGVFVATTPAHVSARAGAERSLSTAYPEHLGINLYWRSIVGGR